MPAVSPARDAAFRVLVEAERGAFASELLRSLVARLASRDAGLASEIVYGVLRRQGQLDWLLGTLISQPLERLDAPVRAALRMGLYQIRHLDRVPARAAVSESVELAKRAGKRSAAGLVNAVLRRAPAGEVAWPDRSVELSMPAWLLSRWDRYFGEPVATGIARAFLDRPPMWVRLPEPAAPEGLEPAGIAGAWRVTGEPPAGARAMDIGSQTIVPLLELAPGQTLLDLCAGPGNKTAQALESGARVVACDRHLSRLAPLAPLGCPRVVLDAVNPLPFGRRFDRILVDAPCSGTGTLGRHPEIKWRLTEPRIARMHDLQVRILRRAMELLEPGGRLVYATCSLEPEENEAVVDEAGVGKLLSIHRRIPGVDPGDGFFAAVVTGE